MINSCLPSGKAESTASPEVPLPDCQGFAVILYSFTVDALYLHAERNLREAPSTFAQLEF